MKTFITLLAVFMTSAAFAQQGQVLRVDSSGTVGCSAPPTKCTISWIAGQLSSDGCDFSRSLSSPKLVPINERSFKMEFEQVPATGFTCSGTTAITPLIGK